MSPKPHDFLVTLRRPSPHVPWGIRLVGGTDLNAPLIITRVQVNSPAQAELLRGDIITKIDQYDARDLTHNDAQNLFRNAGNQMRVTVRRDDAVALHQSAHPVNGNPVQALPTSSPAPGNYAKPYQPQQPPAMAPVQPAAVPAKAQPHQNFPPPDPVQLLPTISSPLPHGPQAYAAALEHPLETLPHTVFPGVDASGAYHLPKQPYPPPAPIGLNDASEAIANQVSPNHATANRQVANSKGQSLSSILNLTSVPSSPTTPQQLHELKYVFLETVFNTKHARNR
uniref:PDZ domain-containing protein n=1 Tax=Anopheles albimanus TaxID=7167 RepID=A0A182F9S3_ANOAL